MRIQRAFSRGALICGGLAAYAAVSTYFRFRPEPEGIHPAPRVYRIPVEAVRFYHDTSWREGGKRRSILQVRDLVVETIRQARRFVLMDVFLFNLHHADQGEFIPLTRQIADAFRGKRHPSVFITDPLNTSYGSAPCEPLGWLRENGVKVCITDLEKLQDNHLLYAPLWHLILKRLPFWEAIQFQNPLRKKYRTNVRAALEALTIRGNHRKVIVADEDDSWVTLIASANLEDASCYFPETLLRIRSPAVARHFLEAERAVARMSGCDASKLIPEIQAESEPDGRSWAQQAEITPLMGRQIEEAMIRDLAGAAHPDEIFVFSLFLSRRRIIKELIAASRRGVSIKVVLDRNLVSFGKNKSGYPNQMVTAELLRRSNIEVRWAGTEMEEFHVKFTLHRRANTCIAYVGSANLTRRSLSGTNLEATVRALLSCESPVAREMIDYAEWICREPISTDKENGDSSVIKYVLYRLQEATGSSTF